MKSNRNLSSSEMLRDALKEKKTKLVKELEIGEKSGLNENFDKKAFFERLHARYPLA
jgi:hypothetical protein